MRVDDIISQYTTVAETKYSKDWWVDQQQIYIQI